MNFPDAVVSCFKKYVTFNGRARRAEYWFFVLFMLCASIVVGMVDAALFGVATAAKGTGGAPLGTLLTLGTLLPSLAVGVRRLHDTNRSGWWLLLCLIPLVGTVIIIIWMATKGTTGDNRFGPDPL